MKVLPAPDPLDSTCVIAMDVKPGDRLLERQLCEAVRRFVTTF
jgi:hypothetical protein